MATGQKKPTAKKPAHVHACLHQYAIEQIIAGGDRVEDALLAAYLAHPKSEWSSLIRQYVANDYQRRAERKPGRPPKTYDLTENARRNWACTVYQWHYETLRKNKVRDAAEEALERTVEQFPSRLRMSTKMLRKWVTQAKRAPVKPPFFRL